MPALAMTVLGVYYPYIPDDVYDEQWRVTGSDERTQEHFEKLVLIEALAENVNGKIRMEEVGQQYINGRYPDHFQCSYDEALLSADGELLIDRRMGCVFGTGPLRFAFYLHFYDLERPLSWSHGTVACPPVQPVSERLRRLIPYRACS